MDEHTPPPDEGGESQQLLRPAPGTKPYRPQRFRDAPPVPSTGGQGEVSPDGTYSSESCNGEGVEGGHDKNEIGEIGDDKKPRLHRRQLTSLRAVVWSANILTNLSLGAIAPFFPQHLHTHYHVSYRTSGTVLGVFPLVALVVSPVCSHLCRALGRYAVLYLGLFCATVGTVGFGFSPSVLVFVLTRGLQGVGFALTTVAGLGLLIQYSPDVTKDLARQEALVGLSFVFSPLIGGLLYTYVAFESVFILLALGFVVVGVVLTISLRTARLPPSSGLWFPAVTTTLRDDSYHSISSSSSSSNASDEGTGAAEETKSIVGGEHVRGWRALMRPGVALAAAAVSLTFVVIGFLELTFAAHVGASLRVGPVGAGALFSALDIAYTAAGALIVGAGMCQLRLVTGAPRRSLVIAGLALQGVGLSLMGPIPLPGLTALDGYLGTVVWVFTTVACAAVGMGEALTITPSVEMMKTSLPQDLAHLPHVNDMLASVMSSATSFGELLGPLIGGVAMTLLPQFTEIGCHPLTPLHPHSTTPNPSLPLPPCLSGFRWSSALLGCVCLAASLASIFLLPRTHTHTHTHAHTQPVSPTPTPHYITIDVSTPPTPYYPILPSTLSECIPPHHETTHNRSAPSHRDEPKSHDHTSIPPTGSREGREYFIGDNHRHGYGTLPRASTYHSLSSTSHSLSPHTHTRDGDGVRVDVTEGVSANEDRARVGGGRKGAYRAPV